MTNCLRCPTCGSSLGPGCDCMFTEWKFSMAKKCGGNPPMFNRSYYSGYVCPKCGLKATSGHYCIICDR